MPKSRKMKNNASSALSEEEMIQFLLNNNSEPETDSRKLLTKHNGLRKMFFGVSKLPIEIQESQMKSENGGEEFDVNRPGSTRYPQGPKNNVICTKFLINQDIMKFFSKLNFPSRYPTKFENEESESFVLIDDTGKKLVPVATVDTKLTKSFVKFWNRFTTKQDLSTKSVLDHQLTDKEAGYVPCTLKTLFNSPDSYLKKSFCQKFRYTGPGYQLLSTPNQFCKISERSSLRMEVNQIFQQYCNPINQYFLIPIEFTSKLSRNMLRSVEICRETQGCNKINFYCNTQNLSDQTNHPLLTIEYKNSIEEELLPCSNMNMVDNHPLEESPSTDLTTKKLYKALMNYPYLSHFVHRNDFNIDNFFARCWHYTRFFCNKLDLGAKTNNTVSISIKDAIFKYLLASSARICIAIKYWVLNPEQATYFRCWCGHRIYDSKQENKFLKKYPIGSADLFNYQQRIQEQDQFHRKHCEKKTHMHICPCNQQFKDHQSWLNHILCAKLSDITKICPIILFNISKSSQEENRFICECKDVFSDYDFWTFWMHICNCKTLRRVIKDHCHCSEITINSLIVNNKKSVNPRKRKRTSGSKGMNENKKTANSVPENDNNDNDGRDFSATNLNKVKRMDRPQPTKKDENDKSYEPEWQSGDITNLPLKVSNQINATHSQPFS